MENPLAAFFGANVPKHCHSSEDVNVLPLTSRREKRWLGGGCRVSHTSQPFTRPAQIFVGSKLVGTKDPELEDRRHARRLVVGGVRRGTADAHHSRLQVSQTRALTTTAGRFTMRF
jgi:hypothetical protein